MWLMSEVSIRELRNHAGKVVDRVARGERITITRAGKAVAELRPVSRPPLTADALLSTTQPRGSATLDKVVYEAAACGVPVVASNAALEEFLGDLELELRFPPRDPDALARILLGLATAGPEARRAAGLELRRRVVAQHSLDSWADAVTALVAARARE